jgi:thiopeptide-type bacteriocin biosynthesis protein
MYLVVPWVLVRTPVLPAASLQAFDSAADALNDPRVVRALAIGSPDLLDSLRRQDLSQRDADRAASSLARYLIRMSTRPTPYGAFAGVSLATWGAHTTLALGDEDRTRTRPDSGWVDDVLKTLTDDADVRADLQWRAAQLAYEQQGRLMTSASSASVVATDAARLVLVAAHDWIPYRDLATTLGEQTGGSAEDVERLLLQMWRADLLEHNLCPAPTGPEATSGRETVTLLQSVRHALADKLSNLLDLMRAADDAPASEADDRYRRIHQAAQAITPPSPGAAAGARPPIFQSDLTRGLDGTHLNTVIAAECARAAELLLRIGPAPSGPPDILAYTRAFAARYGGGRSVPLRELFDPVRGLGPMPHTHGAPQGIDPVRSARRSDALIALALGAIRDGMRPADLDRDVIKDLETWAPRPDQAPLSLDVAAYVAAPSIDAIDAGDFRVVIAPGLGAPMAGRWMGRFADLFGPDADAYYTWLRSAETAAASGALPAEVVYLPASRRMSNVIARPVVSPHEIVVSGRGGAGHQIALDDIVVGLRGDRLVVRSCSLGVELRPTARHMLNHHNAPPVCQFLDQLVEAGKPQLVSFGWGPAEFLPVLPRVQSGRTVLSPARWLLSVPDYRNGHPVSTKALRLALDERHLRWGLPERVYVTSGDNRLLLDVTAADDLEQIARELRRSNTGVLRLTEALPDVTDAWVPGPGGAYLAEIVVSLVRRAGENHSTTLISQPTSAGGAVPDTADNHAADLERGTRQPPSAAPRATDAFLEQTTLASSPRLTAGAVSVAARPPGSDWLFAKFYAPYEIMTSLLTGELADLIDMATNSGLASRWFFIRYGDPEPHLRLRWQGEPDLLLHHLLPQVVAFGQQLINARRVSRIALDTYDREIARFGGTVGLEFCEHIFDIDSRTVRQLLTRADLDDTERACVSTTSLLSGLGLGPADREELYRRMSAVPDPAVKRAAGADYRTRKNRLRALVAHADGRASATNAGFAPVGGYEERELRGVAAQLSEAEDSGLLTLPVDDILPSLLHMHHNRLIGPVGAPSEAHLSDLLLRIEVGLRESR